MSVLYLMKPIFGVGMPLIAVTASTANDAQPYLDAVRAHGANTLLLLPHTDLTPHQVLAQADGLLVTGGADIDPKHYGQSPQPGVKLGLHPARDEMELPILRAALEQDIPVLGICRGMQALNVAMGGMLVQHMEGHRGPDGDTPAFHQIWIAPGSRLTVIIGGCGIVRVNSYHHQGLREAQKAPLLKASAYALDDGVIEAVESPEHFWVMGVQFHPETKNAKGRWECPPPFQRLFETLVRKAGERVKVL
jgi:putative glutamine amidotransferase